MKAKFGSKTPETSLFRVVQAVFRYLEPFKHGSRVWQTDRQTDGQTDGQNHRLTTRA